MYIDLYDWIEVFIYDDFMVIIAMGSTSSHSEQRS